MGLGEFLIIIPALAASVLSVVYFFLARALAKKLSQKRQAEIKLVGNATQFWIVKNNQISMSPDIAQEDFLSDEDMDGKNSVLFDRWTMSVALLQLYKNEKLSNAFQESCSDRLIMGIALWDSLSYPASNNYNPNNYISKQLEELPKNETITRLQSLLSPIMGLDLDEPNPMREEDALFSYITNNRVALLKKTESYLNFRACSH